MRLTHLLLGSALAATSIAVHADTIYGPVTLGAGAPLVSEGFISAFNLLPTYAPEIHLNAINGDDMFSVTIPFTFNLAPGWSIANLHFTDYTDWGTNQTDPNNWGFEFMQKITLCTADGASAPRPPRATSLENLFFHLNYSTPRAERTWATTRLLPTPTTFRSDQNQETRIHDPFRSPHRRHSRASDATPDGHWSCGSW